MIFFSLVSSKLFRRTSLLLGYILFSGTLLHAQEKQLIQEMTNAANALIQTFSPKQKTLTLLTFDDPERLRWSNEPQNMYARKGITMGDLNTEQKMALHQLLQTVLSEQGYFKSLNILRLDEYLRNTAIKKEQASGQYEGHDKYWLTIFGSPDINSNWSWRFEGHHLSLNITSTPTGVTCTPMFFGADPATFPSGPFAGWQNMFEETKIGWQLFLSLKPDQRKKSLISNQIPEARDILTRTGKEDFLQVYQGIAFNELSAAQQLQLKRLVATYLDNLNKSLSASYEQKINWEKTYFGWWGAQQKGKPIYYRIHGPHFIIEYVSRLTDPNHIHSLFRYLPSDFGSSSMQK